MREIVRDFDGVIFDIQRFSVHDGPGIRTTVFMKGCPLKCLWCHNPESWSTDSELVFEERLCLLCSRCVAACPVEAHSIVNGNRVIERTKCTKCGRCADACLTGALTFKGRSVAVNEVMKEVLKDKDYYLKSDGGITLSGGEPLMQPRFLKAVMTESKNNRINTAIETCGYVAWKVFEGLLNLIDYIIYDIKILDPELHKKYCRADNKLILNNLMQLAKLKKNILIRIPLIPGITDTEENLTSTGAFLKTQKLEKVELIPYHSFAHDKYKAIGQQTSLIDRNSQDSVALERIRLLISSYDLDTKIGI